MIVIKMPFKIFLLEYKYVFCFSQPNKKKGANKQNKLQTSRGRGITFKTENG